MATDNVARLLALEAGKLSGYSKDETEKLLRKKADLDNGIIPISQIPPAAIERMVTVEDDAERFQLTEDIVQKGDTVRVLSTDRMYLVIDIDHLDGELGYQVYVAGRAAEAVADQYGNTIDTTYVKAEPGKQLSEENYTAEDKEKLDEIYGTTIPEMQEQITTLEQTIGDINSILEGVL